MNIFIDMDNTIVDLQSQFCKHVKNVYDLDLDPNYLDYNILGQTGIPTHIIQTMYDDVFTSEGFWYTMKAYPDSIDIVKNLSDIHKVYICSKPYNKGSLKCTTEKLKWLEKYMPFINLTEQVIFMSHKHLLDRKRTVLIDDSPDNLNHWVKGSALCFDQPYNRHLSPLITRVNSWKEIGKMLGNKEYV